MKRLLIFLLLLIPLFCQSQTRKTLLCARGYTIMEYSECDAIFLQIFKPDKNGGVEFTEYPIIHTYKKDSVLNYNFGRLKFFYLKKTLGMLCEYGDSKTCINFYNDEMKLNILR